MKQITRFEVIDDTGRALVIYGHAQFDLQDDNKTLKVFIPGTLAKRIVPDGWVAVPKETTREILYPIYGDMSDEIFKEACIEEKRVQLLEWVVQKLIDVIAINATIDQLDDLAFIGAEANRVIDLERRE